MIEVEIKLLVSIPEDIDGSTLRDDLWESLNDLFVMDGYDEATIIDVIVQ